MQEMSALRLYSKQLRMQLQNALSSNFCCFFCDKRNATDVMASLTGGLQWIWRISLLSI
jgi:hypothetical protein